MLIKENIITLISIENFLNKCLPGQSSRGSAVKAAVEAQDGKFGSPGSLKFKQKKFSKTNSKLIHNFPRTVNNKLRKSKSN